MSFVCFFISKFDPATQLLHNRNRMKKLLLALLSGGILALGWPTYGFPLFLFFGFVPLLFIEFEIRTRPRKFGAAQIFGWTYLGLFVWNLITTYWIYYSTASGMAAAILLNTLFMSTVFLLYHHLAKRTSFTTSVVFLTTLWICFEYLHLHWDFSWPWLNLGNGFSEYTGWIQWYEYTGTFGGTLWVWLVNLIVFKFLLLYRQHKDQSILYRGLLKLILSIGIPIGISQIISARYSVPTDKNNFEVLLLQPNIDPYDQKYDLGDEEIGKLLLRMTDENIGDSTKLVVAPETVFADGTERAYFHQSFAYQYGEELLKRHPQTSLLSGISFYDFIRNEDSIKPQTNFLRPGLWFNDYNSAFLLSPQRKDQFYNKTKLVVGVETFPYQNILKPILGDIMINLGGTVAKKTTQDFRSSFGFDNNKTTGPIICYESVYGQFVNGYVQNGAQFLSIITNDAWWEDTQGHKQHLSYARLRALENRRDIARSANTGISAFINQKGEIESQTPYNERMTLKGIIHPNQKITFYTQHGDYIPRIAEFMTLFIFLFAVTRRRKGLLPDKKKKEQINSNF